MMMLTCFFACIWLENPESSQTQEWIQQQRSLFNDYITDNEEIRDSLVKLKNFDDSSIPRKIGDKYYTIKSGIENFAVSPDGNYIAYCTSENGSDWLTCHVQGLPDTVEKIKFCPVVWSADSKGFYYSRYDSSHSIHYHALGSDQSQDRLIYQDLSDGSVGYSPYASEDNRYLIIDAFNGSSGPNGIIVLDTETSKLTKIIPCDGANYWFISSKGTTFYFLTDKNANFRKVISIDINDERSDIIPEGKFLIESIAAFGDYFCVVTSENVASKIALFDQQGKFIENIPLPASGKVVLNRTAPGSEIFFSFTSFFQPLTIYHYQVGSGSPKAFMEPSISIDASRFVVEQVFYDSKDGTKIPMFIAHKKGILLDGSVQTLLTGYGAYGYTYYPSYDASHLFWLERGGILALANIRGGGEYGKSWHQSAVREKKQNSFDDFIAAAEWLIKNKYTSPNHLAAIGMSSGGLLVAASANQRPDLFKAIVVEAGLLDMLRFHLFTIGRFWIQEHGNPDDPNDLIYLQKYSPCHNVNPSETFPSVLVTASEQDDRVVPSHSYKYTAALQEVHKESNIFLRLSKNIGHDTSKSSEWVNERADILTFLYKELED